jgi:DNA polymerase-3 subunit beta
MKLTIQRTHLVGALAVVKSAASSKATLPILGNVFLVAHEKSITLTTTDLDVTLRTKIAADILAKGETTCRAGLLHDLVKSFAADHLTLALDKNSLKLVAGEAKFDLAVLPPEEFPALPKLAGAREFNLLEYELQALLHHTTFARSTDDSRLILNGTLIRIVGSLRTAKVAVPVAVRKDPGITVCACDGKRLAVEQARTLAPDFSADLILPGKAVTELLRLLSTNEEKPSKVNIQFTDKLASFTFGDHTLITRLMDGSYPNYAQIIPDLTAGVSVSRPELLACVRRVALITDGVKLEFRPQELLISAHATNAAHQLGKSSESMLAGGDVPATICVAAQLLLESLDAIDAEEIVVYPADETPVAFHDPQTTWLSVIAVLKQK